MIILGDVVARRDGTVLSIFTLDMDNPHDCRVLGDRWAANGKPRLTGELVQGERRFVVLEVDAFGGGGCGVMVTGPEVPAPGPAILTVDQV